MKRRKLFYACLSLVSVLALGCSSQSNQSGQTAEGSKYPTKPINLIVPFAGGDSSDLSSRTFAEYAKDVLGQSVVVVNKVGGGGSVAHAEAAKATGDGYTILTGSSGTMTVKPFTANVGYTFEDFKPIGQMVEIPIALIVNKNSQFQSLQELVEYAKENPGKLKYGSPGAGVIQHITMENMAKKNNFKMVHIPFKGGNEAVSAVLGGNVDVAIVGATQVISQQKAGELKVLGVTSANKYELLPQTPTFKEQGYDITSSVWFGLFAPKSTPDDVMKVLSDTLEKASQDPKTIEAWKKLSLSPAYLNADDFKKKIDQEINENKEIIKELGLDKK